MFSPIFDVSSFLPQPFNSGFFCFPRVIELEVSTSPLLLDNIA